MDKKKSRIPLLDGLRGIAMLGVLLINAPYMNSLAGFGDIADFSFIVTSMDQWCNDVLLSYVEGKGYLLLAILFGASASLFIEAQKQRQQPVWIPFFRRLLGLALLGSLHIVFVWHGDILTIYAFWAVILAFTLMLPSLMQYLLLAIIGVGFVLLVSYATSLEPPVYPVNQDTVAIYQSGNFTELVKLRILEYWNMTWRPLFRPGDGPHWIWYVVYHLGEVFGLLLLGAIVGKSPLIWRGSGGSPPGAFAVIAIGKMSLTVYLLSSTVFSFLLQSWGLGLFGKVGPYFMTLVALFTYGVFLVICPLYLKRFRQGPFETLLRRFVYWT